MATARSAPQGYSRSVGFSRTAKSQQGSSQLPTLSACYNSLEIPRGVPRRYEEMKADVIKDFSHKRILSLGLDVHHRMRQDAEQSREQAVREAEAKMVLKKDKENTDALEALTKSLNQNFEQRIAKLKKEHQKVTQERILEIETLLGNETLEAVENEREEAQERLDAAVEAIETEMRQEMDSLGEKVRAEELQKTKDQIAEIVRLHKLELSNLRQQIAADNKKVIASLRNQHQEELEHAVQTEKEKQEQFAAEALYEQKTKYENMLADQLATLTEESSNKEATELLLEEVQTAKVAVEDELLKVGKEFSEFIHRVMGIQTGQGEYLLPTTPLVQNILASRNLLNPGSRVRRLVSRASSIGTISVTDPLAKRMLQPGKDFEISGEFV